MKKCLFLSDWKPIGILAMLILLSLPGSGQLTVKEETMTIPTYKIGMPNPMPRFFENRGHQGVQRRIYPYPMDDNLSNDKEDRDYPYIHLENPYIDLGIMPVLGGRIYYAVDRTNGYNWFYHNHVVKQSLIGMVGNWISGSLAWGFPHHHGPNTVEPMDYTIEENADGSSTIWIANTDQRHRLTVMVGYTVWPNSSIVEMTIHPMNRTPISNSFLFWANPAVHCDSAYQVIFPPSVQYVTFHGKRDMTTWPIADSPFNNYDYTGLDISWWKHTHVPSSFFSWDPKEDYFGGYDHNKKAGTAWLGNHHISPGMKYWADGNNVAGFRTNEGLTDNDGRYIELMAGFYTDNQPDYSWLQPYETKYGKMVWFPIRELDGLKFANRNGALNLEVTPGGVCLVRMNSTSLQKGARVVLKGKEKVLLDEVIDIDPGRPYKSDVKLPAGMAEDDLDLFLLASGGNALMQFRPADHRPPEVTKPEPLKPLQQPEEMGSVEELYLAGLRLDQFYNPSVDPMPYYEEALKRDPGDYRVNTQLGILSIKDYNWEAAGRYLQTAVDRITSNYTRPKDGEGLYYLGVVQRALGKVQEAYDNFYRASWSYAWHTPSYYQLAEMDCEKRDYTTALDHLDRALSTGTDHPKALNLKAIVLRKLGRAGEARDLVEKTIEDYNLDHQSLYELYLLEEAAGNREKAAAALDHCVRVMRDRVQSYLELACEYAACGFYPEAAGLLGKLETKGSGFPMVYYYLGYYNSKLGDKDKALNYCRKASSLESTYCFPFRAEEIPILEHAMELNPSDAKAPYYLGNLLYEHQPEKAVACWEKSRELDGSFYIVHRNLGVAYREIGQDHAKALESMRSAMACNDRDPRLLFEMDELHELNRLSPREKYEFLKSNLKVVEQRSETLLRLAVRTVEYGRFDEAIKIMSSNAIVESEGARELQTAFLDAHILRGMNHMARGKYESARADFQVAADYPIGLYGRPRYAQFNYLLGLVSKKSGDRQKAEEYFRETLEIAVEAGRSGSDAQYRFYQGLALRELGREEEAVQVFREMLEQAQGGRSGDFFTQFGGGQSGDARAAGNHYMAGLAYEGLGDRENAGKEYAETQRISPGHIWSITRLESLK